MSIYDLPPINATLNATSALLLMLGWFFIRRKQQSPHITCMVCALFTSAGFLTSYLYYHYHARSVPFTTGGAPMIVYFVILLTHIAGAIVCLPMVFMTVIPALRRRYDRHRVIARFTLPLWMYVSVTGVIVYLMLYQWFPSTELLRRRAAEISGLQTPR
ncbi:MAG: DUF420 domain-containing protein [Verrucomicrobiales bacterium]